MVAFASASFAQDSGQTEEQDGIEEIVVTGVTRDTVKFDATFSLNTLSEDDLKVLGAHGTAELLGNIPGFYPEGGTAGETHNNVLVRGLPQAGGYRYVPNLIDGLPAYEEPEAPFMNNDVFIKNDLMTTAVEAVKGGPGGILYSNALGSAVNYITRTGTQEYEGAFKLELGDWDHVRGEFFHAGPLNDNLTYAVGGFFRVAEGVRDVGYTGNSGGQLRANLLYTSDDESLTLKLQSHVIRDKTNFYQELPFALVSGRNLFAGDDMNPPANPGTPGSPVELDASDAQTLGVELGDGAVLSTATSFYQLYDAAGNQFDLDISDGINPEFNIFTVNVDKELDNGWSASAALRYTSGSNGFSALFNLPPQDDQAGNFRNSKLQAFCEDGIVDDMDDPDMDGIDDDTVFTTAHINDEQLCAVYGGVIPGAATLALDSPDLPTVTATVKGYYADTVTGADLSTATEAPDILANIRPVYGVVDAKNLTADFRLGKEFEIGGASHDLTLGAYVSHYTYDVFSVFASAWSDISEDARLVDFYAVDAMDQQVGPSITRGGVDQPAQFGLGASATMRTNALYALDHFSLLDDRLKVDVGVRWQELAVDRSTTNSFDDTNDGPDDLTPANVVRGSTADTLADNAVNLPDGRPRFASEEYDDIGWSVGANYLLAENTGFFGDISVYATVADSFRLPGFEDFIFGGPATNASTGEIARGDLVEDITQLEGGFRFNGDMQLTATVFYIDFAAKETLGPTLSDLDEADCRAFDVTALVDGTDTCQHKIRDSFRQSLESIGIELEMLYEPIEGLRLQGSLVLQDPELSQDRATRTGIRDEGGTAVYNRSSTDGRRPRRTSEILLNLRPSYTFSNIPLTLYGQVFYYSERFAGSGSSNVTLWPAYTQLNVGALYSIGEDWDLQLHINNLNDVESFTEGTNLEYGNQFDQPDQPTAAGPYTYTFSQRPLLGRTIKFSVNYRF